MRRVLSAVALTALSVCAAHAQQRTLSWTSLDVDAKLAADGELRVRETHRMLFNGDWNGGERVFVVKPGQEFSLVDAPAGYMLDGYRLRWRARQPSDPPFRNAERTYVIEYTLRKVVELEGDTYEFEHDFAFADRPGPILKYTLDLELDPAWLPAPGFTPHIERTNIPPGESVILDTPLKYASEAIPPHVRQKLPEPPPQPVAAPAPPPPPKPRVSPIVALPAFAIFCAFASLLWQKFSRRAAPPVSETGGAITPEWLERNLFVHRPEVVGAAWDSSTGQAEVSALIAVMQAEGKIQNMPGSTPRLKLLVPRETLSDYERNFVDRLFINGDEIDPVTLRNHYKSSGFDPADAIRSPLKNAARNLVGSSSAALPVALGCLGIFGMFFVLPILGVMAAEDSAVGLAFLGMFLFIVSIAIAAGTRAQPPGRSSGKWVPVPMMLFAFFIILSATTPAGTVLFLGAALFLLWCSLRIARADRTPAEAQMLMNFIEARRFFVDRLSRGDSDVEERWIPYLIAFGLGSELDLWVVNAQRVRATVPRRPDEDDDQWRHRSINTPAADRPWFAGGGAFGGAGASGGWGSINSFASAVPRPQPVRSSSSGSSRSSWSSSSSSSSSSRSSSSRSSGGSRSGGGGGGGW